MSLVGGDLEGLALALRDSILSVALNRPQQHNALNPGMIHALTAVFRETAEREDVRVIILTGRGQSFCAGADLEFMRAAAQFSFDQSVAEGEAIYDLMLAVNECPKPVIGRINGAAIGGGLGLVSCCDITVAVEAARFGLSEVRLGLLPAVISPFVLSKIGETHARELFLTGERFDAHHARHIGLIHHIVSEENLDAAVDERVHQLLQAAPGAQAAAKQLIRGVSGRRQARSQPGEAGLRAHTAQLIASRRASTEGQEGMSAFLEKRKPSWHPVRRN
jgi:methylglutaconyl-CoA hydratase